MNPPKLNRTQLLGLFFIGLSVLTYLGGGMFVSSWLASVEPSGVHIYVKDAETDQHLPKDIVTVTITGCNYMGYNVPLNVILKASKTTPAYWSFSSSLYCLYYVSITATGYVTQLGEVGQGQNYIREYTFKLSPTPPPPPPGEDPEPDPEPLPPEESPVETPPVEAEVYVNGVKVAPGDAITLDTLDLEIRVKILDGASSVQGVYGAVDEQRLYFDLSDSGDEYTATYRLPGAGSYDVNVRLLDTAGRDTLLASFKATHGAQGETTNPVEDALEEALNQTKVVYSAVMGACGLGLVILGSAKEEKKRP